MSIEDLKRSVHQKTNEHGEPVVEVPLAVWEAVTTRKDKMITLFKVWEDNPRQNLTNDWWDEFNRLI